MERKNAIITLASKDEKLTATHEGSVLYMKDGFSAFFKEVGEGYKTDTEIHFDGATLVIAREGDISSTMRFIEGEITYFTYGIKEGAFEGKIRTDKLATYRTDNKIMLVISYAMSFGGDEFSEKRTRITVRER